MIKQSMKYLRFALPVLVLLATPVAAQSSYSLRSPNQRIEVRIRLSDRIRYDVLLNGKPLLQDSTLSLKIEGATLGLEPKFVNAKNRTVDQWIEPPIRQKFARVREHFNELRLEMQGQYAVLFRAYNEGVSYRFETNLPAQQEKIL